MVLYGTAITQGRKRRKYERTSLTHEHVDIRAPKKGEGVGVWARARDIYAPTCALAAINKSEKEKWRDNKASGNLSVGQCCEKNGYDLIKTSGAKDLAKMRSLASNKS